MNCREYICIFRASIIIIITALLLDDKRSQGAPSRGGDQASVSSQANTTTARRASDFNDDSDEVMEIEEMPSHSGISPVKTANAVPDLPPVEKSAPIANSTGGGWASASPSTLSR